jgi:hypothetical protein
MLAAFLKSPANRAGLSAWVATVLTAVLQYVVTRTVPPMVDLLGIVVGFVAMVQPDNSVTTEELARAIADVRAAMARKTLQSVAPVIADAEAIVASVTAHPPAG